MRRPQLMSKQHEVYALFMSICAHNIIIRNKRTKPTLRLRQVVGKIKTNTVMKRFIILTMALVCGVMCTDVMARKPKKVDPVQARIGCQYVLEG